MEIRYNTIKVDERYDKVAEIGYMPNYQFEITDEPFTMATARLYRYDKNIQAWVEGEIDEDGNWMLKTEE